MRRISWSVLIETVELDTGDLESYAPLLVRIEVFQPRDSAYYFPKVWREEMFTMRPFESSTIRYSQESVYVQDFSFDSLDYKKASTEEVIESVVTALERQLNLSELDEEQPEQPQ